MEYNVIVKPDPVADRVGSILLAEVTTERDKFAIQTGTVIEVAEHAFSYAEWPEGARKPQAGDRVLFGKYKGSTFGKDEDEVRILKDKDIDAIIIDEAAPLSAVA
jgi:co-chaperonin GroES (HSP10)